MPEFWLNLGFALFLLLVAVAFAAFHIKTWNSVSRSGQDPKELDFYWRQFRRRIQCSAMLFILAIAVFVGQWITSPAIVVILYWGAALLLVVWLALMVVADAIVSVHHYQGLRADCLVEQAKLNAEARRIRAKNGNGKADKKPFDQP